jgi:hypothetical protein
MTMHPDHRRPPSATLLGTALAIAPAAVGCGVGLLLAGRMKGGARQGLAASLFSLGALATLPLVVDYISKTIDHPRFERGSQRRIASIRDSGAFPDADIVGGEEYFLERDGAI